MHQPPWQLQMTTSMLKERRASQRDCCDRSKLTTCFHKLGLGRAFDGGACTIRERLDQPGSFRRHPPWRSQMPTPDASTSDLSDAHTRALSQRLSKLTTCFHKLGLGRDFDGGPCTLQERLDQPGFVTHAPCQSQMTTPESAEPPSDCAQLASTSSVLGELLY